MRLEDVKTFKNIVIVSYSAGGGNILASFVRQNAADSAKFKFIAEGPSKKIFMDLTSIDNMMTIDGLDKLNPHETVLLTGLSGNNPLELMAIVRARALGITSASFLDHWVNYPTRFLLDEKIVYPDWIYAGDEDAKKMALKVGLAQEKLIQIENPYFIEMKKKYESLRLKSPGKNSSIKKILFLCEYLDTSSPNPPKGAEIREIRLLKDFIDQIYEAREEEHYEVCLRLHPSENADKYDELTEKYAIVHCLDRSNELASDLAASDIVMGYQSMALAIAAMLGKKVFSIEKGPRLLPSQDIVYIAGFKNMLEGKVLEAVPSDKKDN